MSQYKKQDAADDRIIKSWRNRADFWRRKATQLDKDVARLRRQVDALNDELKELTEILHRHEELRGPREQTYYDWVGMLTMGKLGGSSGL